MTITVLVHESEEDESGFWAEVPELPGCVSQGQTLDELEANILEAIEAYIAVQIEDNTWQTPKKLRRWDLPIPDMPVRTGN